MLHVPTFKTEFIFRHSAEGEDLKLTKSGKESLVYNGIPDWVSEEEVFEDNKAIWWSPDGTKLVYGVFNDTLVETVTLPRYLMTALISLHWPSSLFSISHKYCF